MEESPHKCPVCSRSFNQRSNLKTHLLTHTDHKPYECGSCGKVFRRNCDLRRHALTHAVGDVPPEAFTESESERSPSRDSSSVVRRRSVSPNARSCHLSASIAERSSSGNYAARPVIGEVRPQLHIRKDLHDRPPASSSLSAPLAVPPSSSQLPSSFNSFRKKATSEVLGRHLVFENSIASMRSASTYSSILVASGASSSASAVTNSTSSAGVKSELSVVNVTGLPLLREGRTATTSCTTAATETPPEGLPRSSVGEQVPASSIATTAQATDFSSAARIDLKSEKTRDAFYNKKMSAFHHRSKCNDFVGVDFQTSNENDYISDLESSKKMISSAEPSHHEELTFNHKPTSSCTPENRPNFPKADSFSIASDSSEAASDIRYEVDADEPLSLRRKKSLSTILPLPVEGPNPDENFPASSVPNSIFINSEPGPSSSRPPVKKKGFSIEDIMRR